mmetsp:Transcript_2998/g.8978  ORF Transcript_2998/g.8978 Transcript_2998/m.8978 type:complete len:263 (-) Transcript_2998:147-935(-)
MSVWEPAQAMSKLRSTRRCTSGSCWLTSATTALMISRGPNSRQKRARARRRGTGSGPAALRSAAAASERALLGLAGRWGSGAGCTCCPPRPASMQGELAKDGEDRPPGVSAFVYRAARPFRPGQLAAILAAGALPGAVRAARGSAWVASRPGHSIVWSSLGNTTMLSQGSDWWAAVPKTLWPAALAEQLRMQGQLTEQGEWAEPLRGDRRTELLVVGVAMSRREVEGCLDALLVSEEELGEGLETWADDSDFAKYLQAEPNV